MAIQKHALKNSITVRKERNTLRHTFGLDDAGDGTDLISFAGRLFWHIKHLL